MKPAGVVAAGAPGTAEVGAEILRAGGSAVDAACAACFATAAFEPALTSLAGGGVMLVHEAHTGISSIVDFCANGPGLDAPGDHDLEFLPVTVDFGSAQQVFHIGRGAAAVPGTLLGIGAAHQRFGRLPLGELVAPACAALRRGVELDEFQAYTFQLLEPILTHSHGVRRIYAPAGRTLRRGDRITNPALATTFEALASEGIEPYYRGHLIPLLLDQFGVAAGGCLTAQDLAHYQVRVVSPLVRQYRGAQLETHVWPSHGGTLVALMLALLEEHDLARWGRDQVDYLRVLGAAMRVVEETKQVGEDPLTAHNLLRWRKRFLALCEDPSATAQPAPGGMGSTTHISVVDAEGNAASVTVSYGEGCGHTLGDTGLVVNNFMGEDDLHPAGFHTAPPGERLATNMCPTAVRTPEHLVVLGSGGANRIRTAMAQVIVNLLDFGMAPEAAVVAGRLHLEGGVVNAEAFDLANASELLAEVAGNDTVVTFPEPNLFFGGVHLVRRSSDGTLEGAGDPRRSGSVVVA